MTNEIMSAVLSLSLTGTEANALTDEQLMTRPFFSGFRDEAILSSSNGIAVASSPDRRASTLAYGIPAESFAVGTGEIVLHEGCRNVNMVGFLGRKGEAMDVPAGPTWTHSAFIGLPLKDVSGLFKDLNGQVKGADNE